MTPSQDPPPRSIRFRGWEIRPQELAVRVRGEPRRIDPQAFQVLWALVQHRGSVLSKDQLFALAWKRKVVADNNITVQISTLRKLLGAEAIVTVPHQGYRLVAELDDPAPRRASPLPPLRPLLGREQELADLAALLGRDPVLTIVGTGGVGKTSLARAALEQAAERWRDGIHWIDLAPLREPAQIAARVAQALDVSLAGFNEAREAFVAAMSGLSALVALDNCEHLTEAVAAFVTEARSVAPGVHWLATSQQPLGLGGERVFRLDPLDLPGANATQAEAEATGALRLFIDRAQAADRHFVLDAANLDAAVGLCRQLDGLPLALEMAAARVPALGLQGVRDELDRRLNLLVGKRDGPSRHHSLAQTFDWSYGLLTPLEQRVFRRLEPFLGGFDRGMAQVMNAPADDGLEPVDRFDTVTALAGLVDKSLVQRAPGRPERYLLYESARAYARQQLELTGELHAVHARHARILAARCEDFDGDLNRMRDADWLERYGAERPNVRAAMVWAASARDPELLARLSAALTCIDAVSESAVEVLCDELPDEVIRQASAPERARALLYLGWAHYADGSRKQATDLIERALQDFEALHDHGGTYRALMLLLRLHESSQHADDADDAVQATKARLRALDGRPLPLRVRLTGSITAGLTSSKDQIDKLLDVQRRARSAGFDELVAMCCVLLTDELLIEGRYDEAIQAADNYLAEGGRRSRSRALICHNQALALVRLGRGAEAQAPARAALRALPSIAHMIVDLFALAAATEGCWTDAAMMAGYGDQARQMRDLRSDEAEEAVVRDTKALLAGALPAAALDELMATGAAMSVHEALALALPGAAG